MDLFAVLFGVTLTVVSVIVAYHFGIKPDREAKKRRAERELEETHRRHWERMRKRSTV